MGRRRLDPIQHIHTLVLFNFPFLMSHFSISVVRLPRRSDHHLSISSSPPSHHIHTLSLSNHSCAVHVCKLVCYSNSGRISWPTRRTRSGHWPILCLGKPLALSVSIFIPCNPACKRSWHFQHLGIGAVQSILLYIHRIRSGGKEKAL